MKRRQLANELLPERIEFDEELDAKFQEAAKSILDLDNVSPKLNPIIDHSNYNIPFGENSFSNVSESCLQMLHLMSIEQYELQANIHYNNLLTARWSPELKVRLTHNLFIIQYTI